MQKTVILGAGLSGISTAHHLKKNYEIFEKEDHPGGLVITNEKDGFHFDLTGHWFHMRDKGIKKIVNNLMQNKLVEVARDSRIYSKGVTTFYPFQTNTFGLPVEVVKEIISGFIDAVYINPTDKEPKTFEQWVLKHMGEGIAKHFMIPYNEKLWCTHPKDMTPFWCQHYVPKPELDQILEGALRPPEQNIGYNASFSYPKKGGIGVLSKTFAESLDQSHIHYQVVPTRILAKKRMVELSNGETIGYENLVSSIPLPELIKLIDDAPQSVKKACSKLVCNQVAYFDIAVDGKTSVPAHWIYYPEKPFVYYRAGCYSNAVNSMAPRGKSSLYVEISHRGNLPPTGKLYQQVLKGLVGSGLVKNKKDVMFHIARNIKYAYVVFDKNYQKSLDVIFPWLEKYGIQSIGRYGKWTYNSMETAMIDGREAALKIKKQR